MKRSLTPFLIGLMATTAMSVGCGDSSEDTPKEEPIVITGCADDSECEGDPAGPVCNKDTFTCEEIPKCANNDECANSEQGPLCDDITSTCIPLPKGDAIGWRDGSATSVTFTKIYEPIGQEEAPDLAFHKDRDELWVVNRRPKVEGVCSQQDLRSDRCRSLAGYTTIIFSPGTADQREQVLEDGNSWHFMRRPPAIAMGDKGFFGTCGEAATGNFEDEPANFMGPSLWTSDLSIYAQPSGGNGSHMDMLHATPFCMGMAHETANIYWLFNGNVGSIDRYDFKEDHGPGADDHSDGEIFRYAPGTVKRVEDVPSHMVFNPADSFLYIADTGNARIAKLDTTSGTMTGPFTPVYEPLAASGFMGDTKTETVVPSGKMTHPSGLTLHNDILYVTDNATSKIHAFTLAGEEVRTLDTGLPEGSLAGIRIGPNNKAWFTNMKTGAVYRIDPK